MSFASPVLINSLGIFSAIFSTLEAGIYSHVEAGNNYEGSVVRWIRNNSISHFPIVQRVMSATNCILLLIPTYLLTEKVLTDIKLLPHYPKDERILGILTWSGLALGATVALGAFLLHRLSRTPARREGEVEMMTTNTKTQLATKAILMGKLALAIAALFLTKNPFWFGLTALSTSYSLWKNYRIKWINLTRDPHPVNLSPQLINPSNFQIPQMDGLGIKKVVTTYRMLQIPPGRHGPKNDNCGICHTKLPDIAFCANHVFHQKCLEKEVGNQTRSMLEQANFRKFRVTHFQNGFKTGTSYRYEVDVNKSKMPTCFTCRVFPQQNKCFIKVHDWAHGVIDAKVNIIAH